MRSFRSTWSPLLDSVQENNQINQMQHSFTSCSSGVRATTPTRSRGPMRAFNPGNPPKQYPREPTVAYPSAEEESEVSSHAFNQAFNDTLPPSLISSLISNKLQQFAAALLSRRSIPSAQDPLCSIFDEFDTDSDGSLTSKDIADALVSRGIQISPEQVQLLIDTYEFNRKCKLPSQEDLVISRGEWANFICSLASADLSL